MSSQDKIYKKLQQQYKSTEWQRRLVIGELYRLIEDLENRPAVRYYNRFPYGPMEQAIHSILDRIEKLFIRRAWAYQARPKNF